MSTFFENSADINWARTADTKEGQLLTPTFSLNNILGAEDTIFGQNLYQSANDNSATGGVSTPSKFQSSQMQLYKWFDELTGSETQTFKIAIIMHVDADTPKTR